MTACIIRTQKRPNPYLDEKVEYLFDKKFTFSRPENGWPLVSPEEMFSTGNWRIPEMMDFKKGLNDWKAKLNDFDLVDWHKHTRTTNVAGNVVWNTRKIINPEFITQAWCKFYEILSSYPVIPKGADTLNSVHLCESPGAFIAALNHYLKLNHQGIQWDWIASSLNPHYEDNSRLVTVPDDRFVLCSLDKWKFGADQTGNIMNLANMESLLEESRKLGPILLVTADGGFDCQGKPGEQEEMIFSLLFCETVTALHILSPGGSFVLKIFTTFEHTTISLIYFLNSCFECVNIFKPVTSKEGNSECYVVCLNYVGVNERKTWLWKLHQIFGEKLPDNAMFPMEAVPEEFVKQLLQCSQRFKLYQEEVLERNVFLFTIPQPASMKELGTLRHRVAEVFLEKFNLRPLDREEDEVVGKTKLAKVVPLQMDSRYENGTFNERVKSHQLPPKEKFPVLMEEIRRYNARWNGNVVNYFNLRRESVPLKIVHGKPVNAVRNSKFCSCQLLELRYQFHSMLRIFNHVPENIEFSYSQELSKELETIITNFCPEILKKVKIIDFQDTLLSSCLERNAEFERKAVLLITDEIENAKLESNLILVGFPMLTRVLVGFILLWAQLFQQVGFVKPVEGSSAVIFRNFQGGEMRDFRKLLENDEYSIVSIVPINELVDDSQFYAQIVAANTYTIKNELARKYLDLNTSNF